MANSYRSKPQQRAIALRVVATAILACSAAFLWWTLNLQPYGALRPARAGSRGLCVAFRSTAGSCDPHAARSVATSWLRDKACDAVIEATESGYCDCGGGVLKAHVWCGHSPFACSDVCADISVAPRPDWRSFIARAAASAIARRAALPPLSGRGIVTVVGGGYTIDGLLLVAALRALGCTLPVEFWYDDAARSDAATLEAPTAVRAALRRLNVTLRGFAAAQAARRKALGVLAPRGDATQFTYAAERGAGRVPLRARAAKRGYLFKTAALSMTRFEEALFLDTDVTPLRDPTFLFDDLGFKATGALLWPDFDRDVAADALTGGLLSAPSQTFWNVLGGRPRGAPASMPTMETGQMVFRRPSESPALRLAHFFLRRGFHYYDHYMIRYAHLALDAPFSLVPTPVGRLGYVVVAGGASAKAEGLRAASSAEDAKFCGHTMLQATPSGVSESSNEPPLFAHRNELKWHQCRCASGGARCVADDPRPHGRPGAHRWSARKRGSSAGPTGVDPSPLCTCTGYSKHCSDSRGAIEAFDEATGGGGRWARVAWSLEPRLSATLLNLTECSGSSSSTARLRPNWWAAYERDVLDATRVMRSVN
tara:strand:- start:1063 stop:2850 length:1788 start_codon:yes stop_codon:yes gene_type:complete